MIKYKQSEVTRMEDVFDSIVCDKCGKEFRDEMDLQEFHRIDFIGGFTSVFGDGNHVQCDLCQHCLMEMIKDCHRVVDVQD